MVPSILAFKFNFLIFGALICYFWDRAWVQKQFLGLILFSIVPSILTLDFDLILGSFLTFGGPNGLFWGLGQGSTTVLGLSHLVEQLSFSFFLSILIFYFDFFVALTGYIWGWGRVQTLFWGLLMQLNNFYFLCYLKF